MWRSNSLKPEGKSCHASEASPHLTYKPEEAEEGTGRWPVVWDQIRRSWSWGYSSGGQCQHIPGLPHDTPWASKIVDGGYPFALRASCFVPHPHSLPLIWTHTHTKLSASKVYLKTFIEGSPLNLLLMVFLKQRLSPFYFNEAGQSSTPQAPPPCFLSPVTPLGVPTSPDMPCSSHFHHRRKLHWCFHQQQPYLVE